MPMSGKFVVPLGFAGEPPRLGSVVDEIVSYVSPLWPGLISLIGEEHAKEHNRPPRLVWIPTTDRFIAAKLQSGDPRTIKTRVAGVSVHCWAEPAEGDFSVTKALNATEMLVNDVIAGIHRTCYGVYEVTAVRWVTQANTILGRAAVIDWAFQTPIIIRNPATETVTVKEVDQTGEMEFPDGVTVSGSPRV